MFLTTLWVWQSPFTPLSLPVERAASMQLSQQCKANKNIQVNKTPRFKPKVMTRL